MSNELYLVAHKVRGQPAFDIATRCECAECISMGCPECDDLGYWWIVPTSGHRAYPYWHIELGALMHDTEYSFGNGHSPVRTLDEVDPMPYSLPDHYPHSEAPTISLTQALGLGKPTAPQPPLVRRM